MVEITNLLLLYIPSFSFSLNFLSFSLFRFSNFRYLKKINVHDFGLAKIYFTPYSMAFGTMAFGTMAFGTMVVGTMAIGTMAVGTMAVGTMAVGTMAVGTMAFGTMAFGTIAFGIHSLGRFLCQ